MVSCINKARFKEETVAIKEFNGNKWDETGKTFLKEAKILKSLNHPNVVNFKMHVTSHSRLCLKMLTSRLGRIADRDILIMIVFRIPIFQEKQLKILWQQNCCYSGLNFLKDCEYSYQNCSSLGLFSQNKKKLADGCSRIFTLHYSSTLKNIQCFTNRISNMFNSTAAHFELYKTCMAECFCENNEQLKEVIYFVKDFHHISLTGL